MWVSLLADFIYFFLNFEIVNARQRQAKWNFSPPQTTREAEEYQVELANVTVLELTVVPNVSG